MAYDKIWVGTDTTTPNEWLTAENWFPAVVPTANEVVLITGSANINGAPVVNVCGGIQVRDFTGTIGTYGTPLDFATAGFTNDAEIVFEGTGLAYLDLHQGVGTTLADGPMVTVYGTRGGGGAIPFGLYLQAVKIQKLTVFGGDVAVGTDIGTTVTACEIGDVVVDALRGSPSVLLGVNATVNSSNNIELFNGKLELDLATATIAEINQQNGTLIKTCGNTVTAFDQWGGSCTWNDGTLTGGNLRGGLLDLMGSTNTRTITATAYKGAQIRDGGTPYNVTLAITRDTNEPILISYG